MNTVDYILVVLVAVSGLVGVLRGFIREALSVLVWILALWGAARYGGQLGPLLDGFAGGTGAATLGGPQPGIRRRYCLPAACLAGWWDI